MTGMIDLPEGFARFAEPASAAEIAHIEDVIRSALPDWVRELVERGCIALGDLRVWLGREFMGRKGSFQTPGFYPLGIGAEGRDALYLFVDVRGGFSSTHGGVFASLFVFPKVNELSLVAGDGAAFIAWAEARTADREANDAARAAASEIASRFPEGFLGGVRSQRISREMLDAYLGDARVAALPPVLRALLLEGWSGLGDELTVFHVDQFEQFHEAPPPMPAFLKGNPSPAAPLLDLVYEDGRPQGFEGVLFFATDPGGRPLAWDGEGRLGRERGAIFLVPQDGAEIEHLAASFDDFIEATLEKWLAEHG